MMDYADAWLETGDGLKISYRVYPPSGEETGVPVLCLHGLTRNLRDFEDLAPKIAAMGRKVICATQRGRGDSDYDPDTGRYNPGVYTQDMLALLDHLGIEKAAFIGTSMGGLMTMLAATIAPHRIARAVLNDIGPELDPDGIARIRSYAGKTDDQFSDWQSAADAIRTINGSAFPNEASNEFWLDFARKTCRESDDGIILDYDPAIAVSIAEGSAADIDLWPFFDALKDIHVLLVRGALSDLLMTSTVESMQRRKPDMKFARVPDVGHAPFLTEADAWPAVRDFLS
ncbi:MAG: alpha/beta hydrolase [Hyphobacterium sp.]|nr:MAG: alpha/beta hydrolase [Hyphobacterium sp.]